MADGEAPDPSQEGMGWRFQIYRAAFEQSRDAIMIQDLEGFRHCNLATLTMFRVPDVVTFATLSATELSPRYQADGRLSSEVATANLEEAMSQGTAFFEWRSRTWDGVEFPSEVLLSRIDLEEGPVVQALVRDISERKAAEEALQQSKGLFASVTEAALDAVIMIDDEGRVVLWNEAAEQILGHSREAALGADFHHLAVPERYYAGFREGMARFAESGEGPVVGETTELTALRADGTEFPMEVSISAVQLQSRWHAVGVLRDISERKRHERRQRQVALVFHNARDGLMITDADTRILEVNPAVTEITGYTADELIGNTPAMLQSGHHSSEFYEAMWASIREKGTWSGEIWDRRKDGQVRVHWVTVTTVYDDKGEHTNYVAIFSDIDELKRYQNELEHQAYHDALTDLPNRALFEDRLGHALERAQRQGKRVAVVFFDLDHFKDINESLGHATGDQLLQEIAGRAAGIPREPDTLARLGADEFTVCLESVTGTEEAVTTAQCLQSALAEPFELAERTVRTTISMGLSLYPEDGTTTEDLIRHADSALYQAKEAGRNAIRLYNAALAEKADERLKLGQQLKEALEEVELVLHYQPQRDLANGELVGLEALVRWQHPEKGLLGPDRFIPLAEEIGQIHDLGRWVLNAACRQGRQWLDAGYEPGRVAVNVSTRQVAEGDVAEQVREVLEATGFPADRLELEITESALMTATDTVLASLEALRELGVTLAVDDFGTGYSSLLYLQRLPVGRLKIDKGFVQEMAANPEYRGIVRAILAMARTLDLKVVAEGVETAEQRAALLEEGAEVEQGFLYARPQPAEAITDWLPAPGDPEGEA